MNRIDSICDGTARSLLYLQLLRDLGICAAHILECALADLPDDLFTPSPTLCSLAYSVACGRKLDKFVLLIQPHQAGEMTAREPTSQGSVRATSLVWQLRNPQILALEITKGRRA